jgi:hypothetical protein
VTGGFIIDTFDHPEASQAELLAEAERRNGPLRIQYDNGELGESFPANATGLDEAHMLCSALAQVGREIRLVTSRGVLIKNWSVGASAGRPSEQSTGYENEARAIVAALEKQVPGRASAVTGPGPTTTVRYYVEGTPIVFNAIMVEDKIMSQAVTEPQGGILWGIKENPLNEEGARRAASQMIEWLTMQIDTRAIEAQFNTYAVTDIRLAMHRVAEHPLRGSETSYRAVTGNGKVSAGQPAAGVRIRRDGHSYRFRLTEVTGELYSWDELTMKTTSFLGFVHAMRDLLGK